MNNKKRSPKLVKKMLAEIEQQLKSQQENKTVKTSCDKIGHNVFTYIKKNNNYYQVCIKCEYIEQ